MAKTRASDELLGQIHEALGQHLLAKVSSGEATAQELNAAIKFLADNHIELDSAQGTNLEKLAHALPTFNDEDEQVTAH